MFKFYFKIGRSLQFMEVKIYENLEQKVRKQITLNKFPNF